MNISQTFEMNKHLMCGMIHETPYETQMKWNPSAYDTYTHKKNIFIRWEFSIFSLMQNENVEIDQIRILSIVVIVIARFKTLYCTIYDCMGDFCICYYVCVCVGWFSAARICVNATIVFMKIVYTDGVNKASTLPMVLLLMLVSEFFCQWFFIHSLWHHCNVYMLIYST